MMSEHSACRDFTFTTYLEREVAVVPCGGAEVGSAPGDHPSSEVGEVRVVPQAHHPCGGRGADSKAVVAVLHPGGTGSDSDH